MDEINNNNNNNQSGCGWRWPPFMEGSRKFTGKQSRAP
jgi:hypothetical protein